MSGDFEVTVTTDGGRTLGTITVQVCGDPIVGLWCNTCRLPSAAALVFTAGNRLMVHHWCEDCEDT